MIMDAKILLAYGHGLGLSTDDMQEIVLESKAATDGFEDCPIIENVRLVANGIDSRTLWIGAMAYSYVLDTMMEETGEQ